MMLLNDIEYNSLMYLYQFFLNFIKLKKSELIVIVTSVLIIIATWFKCFPMKIGIAM